VYDEQRQEISFGFTASDEIINGTRLLFDTSLGDLIRPSLDDKEDHYEALFLYREANGEQRVYGGGIGGKIYKLNQANRNVESAAYTGEFRTPDTDFEFALGRDLALREKRFDYLEMTVTPTGNYNITIDIIIDGVLSETVIMNLGSTGGVLGSFVLGTDRLGGQSIVNHKVRIHGRGQRLSLRGYNSALNQDFSISELAVHLKPGTIKGVR
jgi:hypothetical protein